MRLATLRFVLALLMAGVFSGCVVTTYEGAHEPPRTPALPKPKVAAPKPGPLVISASHLLVQYRGARAAGVEISRSKEEAYARATEAGKRARAGVDFRELAAEYSDEPGAGGRGGALGKFSREQMVPEFSDAAFDLEVGEISWVVESPYGFHVIRRDE